MNPTLKYIICATLTLMCSTLAQGQISFKDSTHLLAFDYLTSGVAMGIADMNGDGYDDIIRLSKADTLKIEYQQPDGSFKGLHIGNADGSTEWSMSIADVDRNGINDIITGGNQSRLKLYRANKIGNGFLIDTLMRPLPHSYDIYTQATSFADIDMDGDIDFFACNDNGLNSVYENDGSGVFDYNVDTSLINTKSVLPAGSEAQPDNVNAGNYGSVWTDYDWDGDLDFYLSKCRAGVNDSVDGRRVNLLLQNDGSGNYTEVGLAAGLRPLGQSWATTFGDLDNDGDLDCFIINHDISSQFFWNNGDGTFTDVTASTGVANKVVGPSFGYGIQVIMEDFDNDTYLDIYLTTLNGVNRMFHNQGDTTFVDIDFALDTGGSGAQSACAGDLNHDGFVDLLIGFAFGFNQPNPLNKADNLQLNVGNSNHFINVSLIGTTSNINAVGAGIEIYGGFGKQIREVRAGESYGIQNSMSRHFGLGTYTTIDSLKVIWPSGNIDIHENIAADQFLKFREGCVGNPVSHTVLNLDDSGAGSLREIMKQVCDFDTIKFDAGLSSGMLTLTSGELVVDRSIVIQGSNITIDANSNSRIFNILPCAEIQLHNLDLINAAGTGIDGGAVYNAGKLTLGNVTMTGNLKDGVAQAIENLGVLNILPADVTIEE